MANKRLNAVITIGGAVSSSLKGALDTTKGKILEVGGAVRKLQREQRTLGDAIQTFGRMGKDVDSLRDRYASVTNELDKQRRALERLKVVEDARERNLSKRKDLRSKMGDTVAFGAAVAVPSAVAVKKSAEFNYQLQVIGNTANMTDAQVKSLGVDIMAISKDVGKSATDTEAALGFLVAAGMEVPMARDNLRTVGRTATATAADIEDVSKASFTLSDALKIQPMGMQKALDALVQSGKEGNFEFKDMAAELPVIGAGFQALKFTGQEAVSTIGAALQIARKGAGSSGEAANNLQNFLAKVLAPDTLKKAKKLGSDLYGVVSKAQKKGQNPFDAAIKEINRITKGGDQKLLGQLFQDMQVQNFLRPMLQNLQEYQRIKKAAMEANGVTDRDFARMERTTKQQLDEMGNSANRSAIAIGDSLEPAVGQLTTVLTPATEKVTEFVNAHQKLVGNSILVVGGLAATRLAALAAGYGYTFLKGGVLSVVGMFARMVPLATASTTVMTALSGALAAVGAAIAATPIGWVVAGVAAIAAAGVMIYKYWEPLKAFFGGFFDGLTAGLSPIGDLISEAFGPVISVVQATVMPILDTVGGWVKSAVGWFGDLLTPIAKTSDTTKTFGEVGKACGEAVADAFRVMLTPITLVLEAIKWIDDHIGGVLDKAVSLGSSVKSLFGFGGTDTPSAGALPPTAPALPTPPAMAGGRGAPSMQSTQHNTFHITQQPGEDPNKFAARVAKLIQDKNGVRNRSMMVDPVGD